MADKLKTTFGRLREKVGEFTLPQKTIALLAIAVLVAAVAVAVSFFTRTTYTPLFSGLSGQDASAIVEQLESEGVPYQLTNGGTTILVPEDQVHSQRLAAAAAGLPGDSSGGYSLLDEMGVTSSEFQQDVTYKRAIEGELAATISEMNGVDTATVQIAVPEKTVFADSERTPTASVFVRPDRGKTLTADQVEAIVHLTSAAVDGMAPTDVAVIDADGNVLSQVGVGTKSPDSQATDYEQSVAAQVQAMLDNVVGVGNATVAVKAEIDTSSSETLTEEFDTPQGSPVLNETTRTESYQGAGGREAGILGPDNIAVPDGGGDGQNTYDSEEATRNNAINKTTRTTVDPAGRVVRQAVSVALDQAAAAPLDPVAIEDLVAAAAGINEDRGDVVEVRVVPFNTDAADAAAEALAEADAAAAAAERAKTLRNAVIAGLLLLALVIFLIVRANRKRRERREALDLGELGLVEAEQVEVPELDAADETAVLEMPEEEEPAEILPPKPRPNDIDQRRAEIGALAATDPQKTVDYLRVMLESDKQKVPTR